MRFLFLATLPFVFAAPVFAASFDCSKATHPLEKTICEDPELSSQDEALAKLYKDAISRVFDKAYLHDNQANWQKDLRKQCANGCDASDIKRAYDDRIYFLPHVNDEIYEASYKTNDAATLKIFHIDGNTFDFSLIRQYLDAPDTAKPLCALPASNDEPGAVAQMNGPDASKANWTAGSCAIDFTFTRDAKGSVTAIDLVSTPACKSYCPDQRFNLDDRFIPANDWQPFEKLD